MSREKNTPRRGWLWASLVIIIALLLGRYVRPAEPDPVLTALAEAAAQEPTYSVMRGIVREHVEATGTLSPANLRVIQADSPGKVTAIRVREGARVASGGLLYEFQPSLYDPSQVQPASPTKVTAPFKGVVASIASQEGSHVVAGQPIMTLIDDSSFSVDIELDEIDIARVAVGMPTVVTLDALDGLELPGTVASVGLMASLRGGVVTLPARIRLDAGNEHLLTGLTAHARITVKEHGGELCIPVRSWIDWNGRPTAIVVGSDGIRMADLEIGMSDGEFTQALSGLSEGDVIVGDAVAVQTLARQIIGTRNGLTFRITRQEG